jgi:hypothetical protein
MDPPLHTPTTPLHRYYDYNCFVSIPLAPFHPALRDKFTHFKDQVSQWVTGDQWW